ncbi:MAG: Hsp20/alpha crystallin family protein [Chloroflexota bacterium]
MSTIIRWNPVREMAAMQSAMDRLFDETWRSARTGNGGSALAVDVHETDSTYTVVANLPGVNPDAISVSLHDGVLTIAAEIARAERDENARVLVQERSYGKFSRSLNLPQPVDSDKVEASYDDGVLTLALPKVPEVQPRQIPVKVGRA